MVAYVISFFTLYKKYGIIKKKRRIFMLWENLREEEFEEAVKKSGGLCVMVLGCLEKHGQHLPVGTDSLKGDGIVKEAAKLEDVVIFPTTMWLGNVMGAHSLPDPERLSKHGFIGISSNTLLTVLEELCDEIARNGFNKILILNSHGGNAQLLDYFVKVQCYNKKNYATMWTGAYFLEDLAPQTVLDIINPRRSDFDMLTDEDYKTLEKFAKEPAGLATGHGGFCETALVYGTYPKTVNPDRFDAECGLSTHRADFLAKEKIRFGYAWSSNYPNHLNGLAPIGCTESIGKAMVKISAERLARIFKMLKEDTEVLKMVEDGIPS
jgi:creatinine amidohydrolase